MIKGIRYFYHQRKWPLAAVVVMAGVIAFIAYPNPVQSVPSNIHWHYVKPQVLENQLGLVGRIEAGTHMIIVAPFEGVVKNMAVSHGQRVEKGQLLLTLDTTKLDIQIREALAIELKARRTVQDLQNWEQSEEVSRARRALANARLNLEDTEANLADTRRLFERGIVARMEVDSQEQQAKTQRLDLIASQAELRAAQGRGQGENRQIAEMELANAQARHQALLSLYEQRELFAAFTGIILPPQKREDNSDAPRVQQGANVAQATPLFELASVEEIKAVARIEEADLHQLEEGMPVQISGDGFANIILSGVVATIGVQGMESNMYGGGTTYEVVININPLNQKQNQKIRLGMSAKLSITTYRVESGLAVPAEALHHDAEGNITVNYRQTMDAPSRTYKVTIGQAVPQGVEVFGLEHQAGYVEGGARAL